MSSKSFTLTLGFLAAFCFAILPGCEKSSSTAVTESSEVDHDHEDGDHDHDAHEYDHSHDFKTIGEATKEIVSLSDTIREEFAAGDVDADHESLHHIGAVLIAAEEMVQKMDDSPQKTAAAAALDSLLDDFTAIDEGLHGDGGKKYDQVSKSIDEAIATLKKDAE